MTRSNKNNLVPILLQKHTSKNNIDAVNFKEKKIGQIKQMLIKSFSTWQKNEDLISKEANAFVESIIIDWP